MRVPEPLRNSPFRIHRRKSLHSLLYGTGRPGPIRPKGNITGSYGVPLQSGPSKTYMSGFPNEYSPHPGLEQTPSNNYQQCDDSAFSRIPRPNQPTVVDEFRMATLELAGFKPFDSEVKYEDSLMNEDLFQQQIESFTEQAGEPLPTPFDTNETAHQIMDAHRGELIDDMALDPDMNIRHIQMAIEEARVGLFTNTDPEIADEDFYGPEPADIDPQDFFEHLKVDFETQFCGPELAEKGIEQALQGLPVEGMDYTDAPGPEDLEQIVEAHEIEAMGQEVLEEPMDEVFEPMDGMESCPEMDPYGNPMMQQEMYDEQMQYMMDPFMNPYMVPGMMGPYMMPDPFGPGPGPSGGP